MIIDTTQPRIEKQISERRFSASFKLAEHKTLFTFTGQSVCKQNQFIDEIKRLHKHGCEIVEFCTYDHGDINWLPRKIWSNQSHKVKWKVDSSLSWRQINIRCVVVDIVSYFSYDNNITEHFLPSAAGEDTK